MKKNRQGQGGFLIVFLVVIMAMISAFLLVLIGQAKNSLAISSAADNDMSAREVSDYLKLVASCYKTKVATGACSDAVSQVIDGNGNVLVASAAPYNSYGPIKVRATCRLNGSNYRYYIQTTRDLQGASDWRTSSQAFFDCP